MDTRTVLSGISYGTYQQHELNSFFPTINSGGKTNGKNDDLLMSALDNTISVCTIEDIISWITSLKTKYDLQVEKIPLMNVNHWLRTDRSIHHDQHKYFSVIAADIYIESREVVSWTQPLIQSAQEGLIGFIVKKIKGVYHFLVQAKIEAGNFDILELAPTVQCLTGNYRAGMNEYEVPFINEVLQASADMIIYKTMQSEEGGRFYREQNLNMIIEVGDDFSENVPENFCWITLNQLYTFIKFNNYLNIQARSLLAAVMF